MFMNLSCKLDGIGMQNLGWNCFKTWLDSSIKLQCYYTARSWYSLAIPPSATKAFIREGSMVRALPEYPVIN